MFNLQNLSKMRKKKLNVLQLIALATFVVVAAVASCSLSSCGKMPWDKKSLTLEETVDSLVDLKVKETINPVFYSVEEAVVYQDLTNDGNAVDSVFNAMSEDTLSQVANVLIKRNGSTSKRSIVKEYLAHKDIYPNLLPAQNKPVVQDTIKQTNKEGSKSKKSGVFSTTYRYRTDTVEGVPVKVQIKEEQSYVTE